MERVPFSCEGGREEAAASRAGTRPEQSKFPEAPKQEVGSDQFSARSQLTRYVLI